MHHRIFWKIWWLWSGSGIGSTTANASPLFWIVQPPLRSFQCPKQPYFWKNIRSCTVKRKVSVYQKVFHWADHVHWESCTICFSFSSLDVYADSHFSISIDYTMRNGKFGEGIDIGDIGNVAYFTWQQQCWNNFLRLLSDNSSLNIIKVVQVNNDFFWGSRIGISFKQQSRSLVVSTFSMMCKKEAKIRTSLAPDCHCNKIGMPKLPRDMKLTFYCFMQFLSKN